MPRRLARIVVVCILAAVVVGCSSGTDIASNKNYARRLINAVYAGSLDPVRDSVSKSYLTLMPDFRAAGVSAFLDERYGSAKDLKLLSTQKMKLGYVNSVWQITGKRRKFEMKLVLNDEGKVAYLGFRPAGSTVWDPATIIGEWYIKKHK